MFKKTLIVAASCLLCTQAFATGGVKVKLDLDSKISGKDGQLAQNLMSAMYLANLVPLIEYNELGKIQTTQIGIDRMQCVFEGLVESESHPSKTLLNTNYLCEELDSRNPDNKLSPGDSSHIMRAVEEVIKEKSDLAGASSFIVQDISCRGEWSVFPMDQGGTRDYTCSFEVDVYQEGE